jgi:hypothetical protein
VTANLCDHPLLAPECLVAGTSRVVRATSESFKNPSAGVRPGNGARLSRGVGITATRGRGDSGDAARGSAITGSAPVTSATPHDTRAPFPGGLRDSRANRSRARGALVSSATTSSSVDTPGKHGRRRGFGAGGVAEGCASCHRRQRSTLASRTRSAPSGVFGPVEAPPWRRHRAASVPSGRLNRRARHGAPSRVLHRAPHLPSDIVDVQCDQCAWLCHPSAAHYKSLQVAPRARTTRPLTMPRARARRAPVIPTPRLVTAPSPCRARA